ncbi:MAG: hypothetical protein U0Q22_01910 [Acidimicrobiales bacterium]
MLDPVIEIARTYSVRQQVGGPRLRLGTIWFLILLICLASGSALVTIVFAAVAAVAGLQTAGAWRLRKVAVNQVVAAAGAALLPLAAWLGLRAVGVVLFLLVIAAVVLGADTTLDGSSFAVDRLKANLPVASATLRSGMFVGLTAAAVVQVHRIDAMSLLFLMSVVCVYDSGDYLVGSGASNRFAGPLAGMAGGVVVVAAMTAINPPPLTDDGDVRLLGLLMVLACPLGQMLASWTLPSSRAKAPALRRLDAWMVAAPLFLVGLWLAT